MATRARPQIHMDDNIINDPELERMLEEREEIKRGIADYRKLDKEVKNKLRSIETPTPYRVGRFVINSHVMPGKEVAFETQDSIRLTIKLAGED